MGSNVQGGSAPPANALSSLEKVNVVNAGQSATPTTTGSLTANLPASATLIAPANLPSANSATSTYTATTSLVVYDNLGGAHTINLYFANTGAGTWEVDAFDASNASAGGGFPYSSGPLATQTLTFGATGALTSGSPLAFTAPNGQPMTVDLSNVTQLATSFNVTAATTNGNAPASLQGVSIAANGTLSFNYSNGTSNRRLRYSNCQRGERGQSDVGERQRLCDQHGVRPHFPGKRGRREPRLDRTRPPSKTRPSTLRPSLPT